jgi:hypothetical protein
MIKTKMELKKKSVKIVQKHSLNQIISTGHVDNIRVNTVVKYGDAVQNLERMLQDAY